MKLLYQILVVSFRNKNLLVLAGSNKSGNKAKENESHSKPRFK